jgi:hypothetical protein
MHSFNNIINNIVEIALIDVFNTFGASIYSGQVVCHTVLSHFQWIRDY